MQIQPQSARGAAKNLSVREVASKTPGLRVSNDGDLGTTVHLASEHLGERVDLSLHRRNLSLGLGLGAGTLALGGLAVGFRAAASGLLAVGWGAFTCGALQQISANRARRERQELLAAAEVVARTLVEDGPEPATCRDRRFFREGILRNCFEVVDCLTGAVRSRHLELQTAHPVSIDADVRAGTIHVVSAESSLDLVGQLQLPAAEGEVQVDTTSRQQTLAADGTSIFYDDRQNIFRLQGSWPDGAIESFGILGRPLLDAPLLGLPTRPNPTTTVDPDTGATVSFLTDVPALSPGEVARLRPGATHSRVAVPLPGSGAVVQDNRDLRLERDGQIRTLPGWLRPERRGVEFPWQPGQAVQRLPAAGESPLQLELWVDSAYVRIDQNREGPPTAVWGARPIPVKEKDGTLTFQMGGRTYAVTPPLGLSDLSS